MPCPRVSVAVIGAGVSGCALAARLRSLGWSGSLALVEAGRGPGGRAASRASRQDPGWFLNHGAPFLTLGQEPPPALLEPLLAAGVLQPWPEAQQPLKVLDGQGELLEQRGALAGEGRLLRGWPAMHDLALGLLDLAEAATGPRGPAAGAPPLLRLHGVRITGLEREPASGFWQLRDAAGSLQVQARWLVLSGTLLAHPRCLPLLDLAEVPLQRASRSLADPDLERLLAAVAAQRLDPRLALLCRLPAPLAPSWRRLPFAHLEFNASARRRWGLERITLQPRSLELPADLSMDPLGLVAQARPLELLDASSAAAEPGVRHQSTDPQAAAAEEAQLIAMLHGALVDALAPWIPAVDQPPLGQLKLMRWGGAFPLAPGLDPEAMVCPASGVALCGDGIAGPGFGRILGAWHSGEWLAERLLSELVAWGG